MSDQIEFDGAAPNSGSLQRVINNLSTQIDGLRAPIASSVTKQCLFSTRFNAAGLHDENGTLITINPDGSSGDGNGVSFPLTGQAGDFATLIDPNHWLQAHPSAEAEANWTPTLTQTMTDRTLQLVPGIYLLSGIWGWDRVPADAAFEFLTQWVSAYDEEDGQVQLAVGNPPIVGSGAEGILPRALPLVTRCLGLTVVDAEDGLQIFPLVQAIGGSGALLKIISFQLLIAKVF